MNKPEVIPAPKDLRCHCGCKPTLFDDAILACQCDHHSIGWEEVEYGKDVSEVVEKWRNSMKRWVVQERWWKAEEKLVKATELEEPYWVTHWTRAVAKFEDEHRRLQDD